MEKWKIEDKNQKEESQKYDNPIPSREFILQTLDSLGKPLTLKELIKEFEIDDENQQKALHIRLRAMERSSQVIFTRKKTYAPVKKLDLIKGKVISHRDGFGFLSNDKCKDLFIPYIQMKKVFDGDIVLVAVSGLDNKNRQIADIVEIVERAHKTLIGRVLIDNETTIVIPEHPKITTNILIINDRTLGAKNEQIVEVQIIQFPTEKFLAKGEIIKVFGDYLSAGMEIDIALNNFSIPCHFDDDVLKETFKIKDNVLLRDKKSRFDLRDKAFVTIDDESAKDFDDAIYAEKISCGYKLFVAIADVSHYVKLNSNLDKEAYNRGTSVYFPGSVIPMLPEKLSNVICSLNPEVERLVIVCEMDINLKGQVQKFCFYEGLILSHARLTYNNVFDFLLKNKKLKIKNLQEVEVNLNTLWSLYQKVSKHRNSQGSINLEIPESFIEFDKHRKIKRISSKSRNEIHKLIEEFMLLANVSAAQFLNKTNIDSIYRSHPKPTFDKINNLNKFLLLHSIKKQVNKDSIETKDFSEILNKSQNKKEFSLIQTTVLRSMSQATYSIENQGHFGLNYDFYTHFTSPIRRYPDLMVHRAIKSIIRSKKKTDLVKRKLLSSLLKSKIYPYDKKQLIEISEHSSYTERRADDASRDVISWLKCEFMSHKIGEIYKGIITNVSSFGLFVELHNFFIEGLIHVSNLKGDYYHFDPLLIQLKGEKTNILYKIGQAVTVQVAGVSLDSRKIDLVLKEINEKIKKR